MFISYASPRAFVPREGPRRFKVRQLPTMGPEDGPSLTWLPHAPTVPFTCIKRLKKKTSGLGVFRPQRLTQVE